MKFRIRLLLTLLAVSVLPMVLINRYAFAFFHNFTRAAHEQAMVHSARLAGELMKSTMDPAERVRILTAHAIDTDSRIRLFNALGEPLLDVGESPGLELEAPADVLRALESGKYTAHWQLTADRTRLYYFSVWPVTNPDTSDLLGAAQVIRHTAPITRALLQMKGHQTRVTWWAAAASLTLALLFSILLTLRLRRLRLAAHTYAQTGIASGFALPGNDEITDLAREFQHMAAELEKRQAYNRDFVLTTLHELKTPLTAIQGAAELLHTRPEMHSRDQQKFVTNITFQAERLTRLVSELRVLTALDLEQPADPPQIIDLTNFAHALRERLQPAYHHPLVLQSPDTPARIRIQPSRLEQVLVNLLDNAARHSPSGQPITIDIQYTPDSVRVQICDQGTGIAPENLGRIFDRFFTTHPKGEHVEQGHGLGLAVVRKIIETHQGRVFAENRTPQGACVGFLLPRLSTGD